MRKLILGLNSPFLNSTALAHDGLGLGHLHWHLGNVVGVIAFGALAGMLIWHLRR